MLKLRATGRGRHYSCLRGVVESVQRVAYSFSWPARVLGLVGATQVRLIEHRLPLLPGAEGRRPLRIAFASDLHIGPLTPPALLDNAFDQLAEAAPDVLALGGDYVSFEATEEKAARLESLVARVPAALKVAVLGNHDLWTRHELLERALVRAGVRVLVDEAVRLPPPHDDVALVGLDEPWTGASDPDRAFTGIDASLVIALGHAPESYPMVRGRGARLLLCGHTHGGQVAAPWGPMMVQGKLGKRWPHGLHELEDLFLFVSRGLGFSDLPIRTFAPSDVALLSLDSAR